MNIPLFEAFNFKLVKVALVITLWRTMLQRQHSSVTEINTIPSNFLIGIAASFCTIFSPPCCMLQDFMRNFCMRFVQPPCRSYKLKHHARFEDYLLKALRNQCENITSQTKIIQKEKNIHIHHMYNFSTQENNTKIYVNGFKKTAVKAQSNQGEVVLREVKSYTHM